MALTTNQQRVLSTLQQASVPLTAYALLEQLREHGISAPTQIYRALERLSEQGLVHRLQTLNAYVSCAHTEQCQHGFTAFAICDRCGSVDEFIDHAVAHSLHQWVKNKAFAVRESAIEIRGQCASCTAQLAAAAPA